MPNLTLINCFTKRLRYMAEHIDFSLINYLYAASNVSNVLLVFAS